MVIISFADIIIVTKIQTYYGAEQKVDDLLNYLTFLNSVSLDLGAVIEQYGVQDDAIAKHFGNAATVCKWNFEKLRVGLKSSKVDDSDSKSGEEQRLKINVEEKIKMA